MTLESTEQTDLCYTPATELGRLYRAGELSPVEVTDAVLARIERLNPRLRAYLTVTDDLAREQARASEARARRGELIGPLDGVPYSIKDLEPTAGIRTTYGSKWFEHFVPDFDGIIPQRMKPTGAVLLGKTNSSHYGYKDMCDNLLGPPCVNPWKLDRTSGASSGGAGSAAAAGLGPLAHGSDGAGSIRIPSALCGLVGFKASFGRVPFWPFNDYWSAIVHNGPMTRTVRDAALMLNVLAGPDPRDPHSIDATPDDYLAACEGDLKGLRIAYSEDFGYAAVEPEVRVLTRAAARSFTDFGCTLDERDPGWDDPGPFHTVLYEVLLAAHHDAHARERPEWIEATLMRHIENGRAVSGVEHHQAIMARTAFYESAQRFFGDYDLLLTPQMPLGAWSAEPGPNEGPKVIEGRSTPTMFDHLPFTFPFNMTGQPALTVPCGFTSEGLPVGLQIVGRWHADSTVIRAAACFEAARPWAQHRPPLD